MTIQQSILAGAAIIGASIVLSQLVTPYQMSSGPGQVWRVNRVTGEVRECVREIDARSPLIVADCKQLPRLREHTSNRLMNGF